MTSIEMWGVDPLPLNLGRLGIVSINRVEWCIVTSGARLERAMQLPPPLILWELSLPGCFILDLAPCCEKPELHRDATCQCFGDCPSWAHVSDMGVRKPPDDFSPQLSESPAAICILPAEAPNTTEQKQATLLCSVHIPEPSSVNISKNGGCLGVITFTDNWNIGNNRGQGRWVRNNNNKKCLDIFQPHDLKGEKDSKSVVISGMVDSVT